MRKKLGQLSTLIATSIRSYPFPLIFGWVGTGLFTIVAIWLAPGITLKDFFSSEYANLGQFLSGIFAPMAFLWLIVAVLLQTSELKLQREELKSSVEALKLQAKETAALVAESQRSGAIAETALKQQLAREEERRLNGLIDLLASRVIQLSTRATVRDVYGAHHVVGEQAELKKEQQLGGQDAILVLGLERLVAFNAGASRSPGWQTRDGNEVRHELNLLRTSAAAVIKGASAGGHRLVIERIEMLELRRFCEQLEFALNWYEKEVSRGQQ